MKERLVVIGNGMAGIRTLEELLKLEPERYAITVFGDEPHPNYNRIMLSPVLAGEKRFDEIMLNERSWYHEHGITLHTGAPVTAIDRVKRKVTAADGAEALDALHAPVESFPAAPYLPGPPEQGGKG